MERINATTGSYNFIDLFAGAGGLSEGFIQAGFSPVAHVEMNPYAAQTLETRTGYYYLKAQGKLDIYKDYISGKITRDEFLQHIPEEQLQSVFCETMSNETLPRLFENIDRILTQRGIKQVDVIIGGPPCQAYSLVGRAQSKHMETPMSADPRNDLYKLYARFLQKYHPKMFVFENVMGIKSANSGATWLKVQEALRSVGYEIECHEQNSKNFGVLQNRRRMIIVGWLKNTGLSYPQFEQTIADATVNDILSDLPALQPGGKSGEYRSDDFSDYLRSTGIRKDSDILTHHCARPNKDRDIEIYRRTIELWNDGHKAPFECLLNADIEPNPHQVNAFCAAIQALKTGGIILADEVGLGKTIEAGLVLNYVLDNGAKKVLISLPATLRKQWEVELLEKFGRQAVILDRYTVEHDLANVQTHLGNADEVSIVIASYDYSSKLIKRFPHVKWDFLIIDEAHNLRNVFHGTKRAKNLYDLTHGIPKILLTATPLQNSLTDLHGLVSFIDPRIFGSEKVFNRRFVDGCDYEELKQELLPVLYRTLRRDVGKYMAFSKRTCITVDFHLSAEEKEEFGAALLRRRQNIKEFTEIKQMEYSAITHHADPVYASNKKHFKAEEDPLPDYLLPYFKRVIRITRLREVRVLLGFTRVDAPDPDADEQTNIVYLNKGKTEKWLPAAEVHGEGVFIEFNRDSIDAWLRDPELGALSQKYAQCYKEFCESKEWTVTTLRDARYVLMHTFAHLLIKQMSMSSGYSSSAIRERIYFGDDMSGVLLYTGSADKEGSLGGLVELGNIDQLIVLMKDAFQEALVCTNDPECLNNVPAGNNSNGAACHSCCMISETACENGNRMLDRGLAHAGIDQQQAGFQNSGKRCVRDRKKLTKAKWKETQLWIFSSPS